MAATIPAVTTTESKGNKVVLAGGPKSGKKYLLTKIITAAGAPPVVGAASLSFVAHPQIANISHTSWTIDNKYYTAPITWWLAPIPQIDVTDEKANVELGRECQALVLSFDISDESSFDHVKQYALFIAQYNPAVLLLAANEMKQGAADTPAAVRLRREAQDFALDNQMELVMVPFDHVHAGLPKPPSPPPETGAAWLHGVADDREKNGTDRLVEALHCNPWTVINMKPKPVPPGAVKKPATSTVAETKSSPAAVAAPTASTVVATPVKVAPATPSAPGQCDSCDDAKATHRCDECPANLCASCAESEHKSKLRRHHTITPIATTTPSPAPSTTASPTPAVAVAVSTTATPVVAARAAEADTTASATPPTTVTAKKVRGSAEELASLEGLDALVDRLRSVRGDAQNGGGNDDERRRRAAQAVMAMMGQLGLEDDDDDDDLLGDM